MTAQIASDWNNSAGWISHHLNQVQVNSRFWRVKFKTFKLHTKLAQRHRFLVFVLAQRRMYNNRFWLFNNALNGSPVAAEAI